MSRRQPAGERQRFALATGAVVVVAVALVCGGFSAAAAVPAAGAEAPSVNQKAAPGSTFDEADLRNDHPIDDHPDVDPRALIRSTFDDGDLYDAHPFDTSRALVESTFDESDRTDGHPVDSDRPLIDSDFDRSDIVDRHPVSDEHPTGD